MEWQILTTFFAFISVVLLVLLFTKQHVLARKLDYYLDHNMTLSDKVKLILSIVEQIESKQDLMFKNARPMPGEVTRDDIGEDLYWENPKVSSVIEFKEQPGETFMEAARRAIEKHNAKVFSIIPPKKRGRPKKSPDAITIKLEE